MRHGRGAPAEGGQPQRRHPLEVAQLLFGRRRTTDAHRRRVQQRAHAERRDQAGTDQRPRAPHRKPPARTCKGDGGDFGCVHEHCAAVARVALWGEERGVVASASGVGEGSEKGGGAVGVGRGCAFEERAEKAREGGGHRQEKGGEGGEEGRWGRGSSGGSASVARGRRPRKAAQGRGQGGRQERDRDCGRRGHGRSRLFLHHSRSPRRRPRAFVRRHARHE
mmetsp:Transcript_17132/g.56052  ORF Transcript_17132/g.56052 Transcript_17132/m.56052 type:complete len:222 (+) Transcript_17132:1011-1676(+)